MLMGKNDYFSAFMARREAKWLGVRQNGRKKGQISPFMGIKKAK